MTIKANYEPVDHCGKIAQTAVIKTMNQAYIRTGDKALLHLGLKV